MGAVVDEEKKKLKTRISGKKKSLALQQEIEKLLQQKKEVDEGIKLKRPVYRKKFLEELAEKVIAVCNMEEDDKVCDEPIEFRQCRDRIVEKIKYWKNIAEAQSQNNDDVNGNAENEKNESESAAILEMGDINGDAENEKNESGSAAILKMGDVNGNAENKKNESGSAAILEMGNVNGDAENKKNESGSAAILKMGDVNGDAENEKNEAESAVFLKKGDVNGNAENEKNEAE